MDLCLEKGHEASLCEIIKIKLQDLRLNVRGLRKGSVDSCESQSRLAGKELYVRRCAPLCLGGCSERCTETRVLQVDQRTPARMLRSWKGHTGRDRDAPKRKHPQKDRNVCA